MQFICHPVAMGIYGKIGKDERTGGAVARPAASEWKSGRHPKR